MWRERAILQYLYTPILYDIHMSRKVVLIKMLVQRNSSNTEHFYVNIDD